MSNTQTDHESRRNEAVQEIVLEQLRKHESFDSNIKGQITDVAALSDTAPLKHIEVAQNRMTPESKKTLRRAVESGDYETLIAVSVELNCGDVFVELYTYEDNPETNRYESIQNLLFATGTDASSIHYLDGEEVTIQRENNRWVVSEGRKQTRPPTRINSQDFLAPFLISTLLVPLSAIITSQFDISQFLGITSGVLLSLVTFEILLYLRVATRGDFPLPELMEQIYQPDQTDGYGKLDQDGTVTDIEGGEFKRLVTLADEEDYDRARVVLRNLAVVVHVPSVGEHTVPIPSPTQSWTNSTIKKLTYHLASSVDTLDRSQGKLIPLQTEDGQLKLDRESLNGEPIPQQNSLSQIIGETYVQKINSALGVPSREELYSH